MNAELMSNPNEWVRGKFCGIAYPRWYDYEFWRSEMCPRGMHLFDECLSGGSGESMSHYLVCDACQLMVAIQGISAKYCVHPIAEMAKAEELQAAPPDKEATCPPT